MLVHGCNECVRQLLSLILATALLGLVLSGCSTSPLPSGHKRSFTSWTTFDEAKQAYDKVVVRQTTFEDLKILGFDPFTTPNVKRLTYLDVINFFMPNPSIKIEQLAPGLQQCLWARAKCYGVEAWPKSEKETTLWQHRPGPDELPEENRDIRLGIPGDCGAGGGQGGF